MAQNLDLQSLLVVVMNWRARLISPRPRTVHLSQAIQHQPALQAHKHVLREISQDLEAGRSLTPRLSTEADSIVLPPAQQSKRSKRRLDAMLSDWGVYHLHLGAQGHSRSRYVERTGDLLFLLVGADDAWLIGVYDHDQWAAEDVLRVIVTEWLEHSKFHELPQGVAPATVVDPDWWLELRNGGVNTILSIDGRHYMAGDMTLEHGSLAITEAANDILIALERADAEIANAPSLIHPKVKAGWYGTESVFGFRPVAPLPWWFDGHQWSPQP
nr:hypothetical protein [Kocuria rhizophila]